MKIALVILGYEVGHLRLDLPEQPIQVAETAVADSAIKTLSHWWAKRMMK